MGVSELVYEPNRAIRQMKHCEWEGLAQSHQNFFSDGRSQDHKISSRGFASKSSKFSLAERSTNMFEDKWTPATYHVKPHVTQHVRMQTDGANDAGSKTSSTAGKSNFTDACTSSNFVSSQLGMHWKEERNDCPAHQAGCDQTYFANAVDTTRRDACHDASRSKLEDKQARSATVSCAILAHEATSTVPAATSGCLPAATATQGSPHALEADKAAPQADLDACLSREMCHASRQGTCVNPGSPPDGRSGLSAADTAYACGDSAKATSPPEEHCWVDGRELNANTLAPYEQSSPESAGELDRGRGQHAVKNMHEEMMKHKFEKRIVVGLRGQFQIVRKLGAGGFATVYKAWNSVTQKYIAIKVFTPHQNSTAHCITEANYLRKFGNESHHVIHLVECPPVAPSRSPSVTTSIDFLTARMCAYGRSGVLFDDVVSCAIVHVFLMCPSSIARPFL
jgi:hypothetical protein